jgi:hypothetical protein
MKMYPKVQRPNGSQRQKLRCKINLCNHLGDECIATFDPAVESTVKVAQDELTAFLDGCVKQYGSHAPVWGHRIGTPSDAYDAIQMADLPLVDDVVIHAPLAGG